MAAFSAKSELPRSPAVRRKAAAAGALSGAIFAGVCALGFVFVFASVFETKGLSLEQIAQRFRDDEGDDAPCCRADARDRPTACASRTTAAWSRSSRRS